MSIDLLIILITKSIVINYLDIKSVLIYLLSDTPDPIRNTYCKKSMV